MAFSLPGYITYRYCTALRPDVKAHNEKEPPGRGLLIFDNDSRARV
jgi:hypothetical protein